MYLVPISSGFAAVLLALLARILWKPEIAEKWAALIGAAFSRVPGLWAWGNRRYMEHDVQSRVNRFTESLREQGPFFTHEEVKIEWINENADEFALLADNRIIVRLGRDEHEDLSFVRASVVFVQQSLMSRLKSTLSDSQSLALDAFVLQRLIAREKPGLLDLFDNEYASSFTSDPDVLSYFDNFALLESRGLFWDVFLQELVFLQQALTFELSPPAMMQEVDSLIKFAVERAGRPIGELVHCDHWENPFRLSLVYVGKEKKVVERGASVWIGYIDGRLSPSNVATIYLIASERNRGLVDDICEGISGEYAKVRDAQRVYYVVRSGKSIAIEGLVTCLRSKRLVSPAQPSVLRNIDDGPLGHPIGVDPPVGLLGEPGMPPSTADSEAVGKEAFDREIEAFDKDSWYPVIVTSVGDEFGFVSTPDGSVTGIYFKTSSVPDVCGPISVGQGGQAKLIRYPDGRTRALELVLTPHAVDWPGEIARVERGYGMISSPGGTRLRFSLKDLDPDSGRIMLGTPVIYQPVLTKTGNLRARKIRVSSP